MPETDLTEAILAAAVEGIEGAQRPGQHEMAGAVAESLAGGDHLLVQAGTGTGKSLGYLAPALAHLVRSPGSRIIVATATLALQAQLARKDIPTALAACQQVTGKTVSHAILKGRTNYACLYRVRDGLGLEQESLLGGTELAEALTATATDAGSKVGAEVIGLREWIETQARSRGVADRDDAPTHGAQAWTQVSIPARECLGAQRCPYGGECFVERSRDRARSAQLVVTNHALLAIDAMHGGTALPEHNAVIIDEAHELVARVTGAASHELSPQTLERVARRCLPWLDDDLGVEFLDSAETLRAALDDAPVDRVEDPESGLGVALRLVRDVARRVVSAMTGGDNSDNDRVQAAAAAKEVFDVAAQLAGFAAHDVVWVSERERFGRQVNQAPLSVAALMREGIFAKRPVVLTSATLTVGGTFEAVASNLGLTEPYQADGEAEPELPSWRGLDVGSPFDYRRQGILAGPGRHRSGHPGRGRGAVVGRRWPHARAFRLAAGRRGGGPALPARTARPGDPVPRGCPVGRVDPHVRRHPRNQPVRHAVAVAGRRRSR